MRWYARAGQLQWCRFAQLLLWKNVWQVKFLSDFLTKSASIQPPSWQTINYDLHSYLKTVTVKCECHPQQHASTEHGRWTNLLQAWKSNCALHQNKDECTPNSNLHTSQQSSVHPIQREIHCNKSRYSAWTWSEPKKKKMCLSCEPYGFHCGVAEASILLGYDTVSLSNWLPKLRCNIATLSSWVKMSQKYSTSMLKWHMVISLGGVIIL
jgi:hypothetical protein